MRPELRVEIIDGELRITLPVKTLAKAATNSPAFLRVWDDLHCKSFLSVTDEDVFAKSILRRMNDEGEDGSTLITRMFDMAFECVVEQGDDGFGFEEPEDIEDDE